MDKRSPAPWADAGLSWLTILRKRDGYRRAFASFDPE
jgi:DNA-3-methyladenine glycosylase I